MIAACWTVATVLWAIRTLDDVPAGDDWLGPREREELAALPAREKRRAEWRLGRCVAKSVAAAWLGRPVEVLAAADGAPEAWEPGGDRAPVALSLSHRHGRALAVAAPAGVAVGCDLESPSTRRDLPATLTWSAREAAAKARREGVRLHGPAPVATAASGTAWAALEIAGLRGWWRADAGWVMAVAADPPQPAPSRAAA